MNVLIRHFSSVIGDRAARLSVAVGQAQRVASVTPVRLNPTAPSLLLLDEPAASAVYYTVNSWRR